MVVFVLKSLNVSKTTQDNRYPGSHKCGTHGKMFCGAGRISVVAENLVEVLIVPGDSHHMRALSVG